MELKRLMKSPVLSCSPNDSLESAARIMWENDFGCLPVTDGEGRLVGMITDRDICMAAYLQGGPLRTLYVGSAMAREVFSCRPEDTIDDCKTIMRAKQVRRLPVIDGEGGLIGIVSLSDLGQRARRDGQRQKGAVTYGEVGETLQAISKPRRAAPLATAA